MSRLLIRLALAGACAVSAAAAWASVRYLSGSQIIYAIPHANESTTYAQAGYADLDLARGLKLNPMDWEGHVRRAGYLVVKKDYTTALEELRRSRQYYASIPALLLEGTIQAELKQFDEAIRVFEKLRRVSFMDRAVYQQLMRIYADAKRYDLLREVAIEADMRWPNAFDTQVALANVALEAGYDVPLTFKHFILAHLSPLTEEARPKPRAFDRVNVHEKVRTAAMILDYQRPWARWP